METTNQNPRYTEVSTDTYTYVELTLMSGAQCVCVIHSIQFSHSVVSKSWTVRFLSPWNSPGKKTGVGCISFSRGSYQHRDGTSVSCIVGKFFTVWATREDPGAQCYYINRCLKGNNMKPHSKSGPGNNRHLMGNGPEVPHSSKITV